MGRRIFNTIGVFMSIGIHKAFYDEVVKKNKKIGERSSLKKSFWNDIFDKKK